MIRKKGFNRFQIFAVHDHYLEEKLGNEKCLHDDFYSSILLRGKSQIGKTRILQEIYKDVLKMGNLNCVKVYLHPNQSMV